MKKILGLDIGIASIGWALIHEPEHVDEQYAIAGIGVRIVPLSPDENNGFSKGDGMSKNALRTLKRGARRLQQRYKLRRQQITTLFQVLEMHPEKELFELDAVSLYGLRAKALSEQVSLHEIARIFYHLNQKRGFKSNRKANNEEEQQAESQTIKETNNPDAKPKKKGYLDFISDREQALKDQGLTIGQHFYQQLLVNPIVRIKENIYLRSSYMDEFDRIWANQQRYYPNVLTEANKQKIRNEIIYYQRRLKSQKGLVRRCQFERQRVAPKSSPLFQLAKIWQELNIIELTSFKAIRGEEVGFDKYGKRMLTLDEKRNLLQILTVKGKLTTKECLKVLGYQSGYKDYKLNIRKEKELEGNRTYAAMEEVFNQFNVDYSHLLRFDLVTQQVEKVDKITREVHQHEQISADCEKQPLYQLWHLLYSVEEMDILVAKLQSRYGFTPELAKALAKIDFHKQGYGGLSAKAIRNILPYLQQGANYADACKKVGYNHSGSTTKAENELRQLDDELELYPKNSLRQPVVEKIVNQVINLVNEIIDEKNGFVTDAERHAPDRFEIRIELARELRQSVEERNKTFSRNESQKRQHQVIENELKRELGFKKVSRKDIERYKLWKEFGGIAPYEPGTRVSLAELYSGLYDIDHIIPKARLFDDSFVNKTICRREINGGSTEKNNRTAYDYMSSKEATVFNEYVTFIKDYFDKGGISEAKFEKLMMPMEMIPDDFITRQLQLTRFITKEAMHLLEKVCRNVHATSGPVTNYLRHNWGYDGVLQKLNWHKYERIGKTAIEHDKSGNRIYKIIDWSKRDDHRNHAVDALVIACTKQRYIKQLNERNKNFENCKYQINQSALKEIEIKTLKPFVLEEVMDAVNRILISFKSGKRVGSKSVLKKGGDVEKKYHIIPRDALHEGTTYGRIKKLKEVKLSTTFKDLEAIVYPEIKVQVEAHLQQFDNDIKKAFNKKNRLIFKEKMGYDTFSVYEYANVVRYKLDAKFEKVDSIVDEGVKAKVKAHLATYDNNPKVAFKSEHVVWINQEKGIAVRSVRCFTKRDELKPLRKNDQGKPIDFVKLGNNHHVSIYRDKSGRLRDDTVTFWDAVKRKQKRVPVIITNPRETWDELLDSGFDDQEILNDLPLSDWEYITSMQQNEMFIFGLPDEELQSAIHENDFGLISKHLYRVQSVSKNDFSFRHHLETKDDKAADKELKKSIRITSLKAMTGIKVKINNLGRIVKVGELPVVYQKRDVSSLSVI